MRKKIFNLKILNYALWTNLIFTLLYPIPNTGERYKSFGYPLKYLTFHEQDLNRTFLSGFGINVLNLIQNIIVFYVIFLIVKLLFNKVKNTTIGSNKI
ncbi:hypothetical protein [Clostridium sp. B9]|uniref:hypothetical protein n=1 Tax=Clostridium sp. B9 TaxID=3423224 RepID=UPI003D2F3163